MAEPWLRGTLTEVEPVRRAVLHALELAREDAEKWCEGLSEEQLNARPQDIAPVAFHLRHMGRTLDRLLTYAEGNQLSEVQIAALKAELYPGATKAELFAELDAAFEDAKRRILAIELDFATPRGVGKKQLPTTVGGLIVHCADHTQRHVGQLVTTAKIVGAK